MVFFIVEFKDNTHVPDATFCPLICHPFEVGRGKVVNKGSNMTTCYCKAKEDTGQSVVIGGGHLTSRNVFRVFQILKGIHLQGNRAQILASMFFSQYGVTNINKFVGMDIHRHYSPRKWSQKSLLGNQIFSNK